MPLLEVLGAFAGSQAVGKLRERVRPNPYAPELVDQGAIAARQAGALRPGTSGIAGSEADWYSDPQGASTIGYLRVVQDVTSVRRPPSYFMPGDPGADPSDPTVLADFRRRLWDQAPSDWGGSTRGSPHVLASRLNPPLLETPLPREVVEARAAGAPQADRDAWAGLYEG